MIQSTIHKGNLIHSRLDGLSGTVDLRNHAASNDALLLEPLDLSDMQVRYEGCGILGVGKQTRHVAHENQAFCLKGDSCHGRSHIGIAIVELPIFIQCGGTDDGCDPLFNAIMQVFQFAFISFAGDSSNVSTVGSRDLFFQQFGLFIV